MTKGLAMNINSMTGIYPQDGFKKVIEDIADDHLLKDKTTISEQTIDDLIKAGS